MFLTEMDRGTPKINNRKQKYIYILFFFVCLHVCMITFIFESIEIFTNCFALTFTVCFIKIDSLKKSYRHLNKLKA